MSGRRRPPAPAELRERLYELLPAFLRYRDQSDPLDSPLRALMAVLERQHTALERDIGGLYDDWFIETCQEWVAPYLGDLLGVRGLDRPEAWVPGQRTRIANALTYRRRKGTLGVIESVARDVTGWPCVAVPFFDRLAVSQALEHPRPGAGGTVDLRDRKALARLGGPFDRLARRPQISGVGGLEPVTDPRAGYNIPNLGLYFWRLPSYPVRRGSARKIAPGCYTFHPLGYDQPLFNAPRSADEACAVTGEGDVPGPLLREQLAEQLSALRRGNGPAADPGAAVRPAVEVLDPRTGAPLPWRCLRVADLGDWRRPGLSPPEEAAAEEGDLQVAIDPVLGRLAFAGEPPAAGEIEVGYRYARCGDVGGGAYPRGQGAATGPAAAQPQGAGAPRTATEAVGAADGHSRFRSLQAALAARPRSGRAVIELVDSATYGGWSGLELEIEARPGDALEIVAAPGASPAFIGDLRLVVGAGAQPSRLTLEGLTLGGRIVVAAGEKDGAGGRHACEIELRHCTLMAPGPVPAESEAAPAGGIQVAGDPARPVELTIRAVSSILGPVRAPNDRCLLQARDSVIDGGTGAAISGGGDPSAAGCVAELTRCTLFGAVTVARLTAEETLFADPLCAADTRLSRLRHCYLPPGSAPAERIESCLPGEGRPAALAFTSRVYGQPGYAQLSGRCAREIRTGAANGSEIGAFSRLGAPFRQANLAGVLDEHLPAGLEPRVFHVT